jgi:hypothetical protein
VERDVLRAEQEALRANVPKVADELTRYLQGVISPKTVRGGDGPKTANPPADATQQPTPVEQTEEPAVDLGSRAGADRSPKDSSRRLLAEQQFRQRLEDAGRRILTSDTSGRLPEADRKLIQSGRKLTKRSVCSLVGCGKTTFDEYLSLYGIDWSTWKVDTERRWRGH